VDELEGAPPPNSPPGQRLPLARVERLAQPLGSLADAWRTEVRPPRRKAMVAVAVLATAGALLVARQGTVRARLIAGAILLGIAVLGIVVRAIERRRWEEPARVIRRLAGAVDPERAERAVRALSLLERDDPGTSRELARLHVARALGALPRERILEGASRVAYGLGMTALVLGIAAGVLGLTRFWSILEGADVLAARPFTGAGVAPVDMRWFVDLDVVARPPDYLHEEEHELAPYARIAVARGTLLTVRGTPSHAGRHLALSGRPVRAEGGSASPRRGPQQAEVSEVPFVDDGTGRLIARWPVAETVDLRVVARFGDVLIEDPDVTRVQSIPDLAPIVTLEGAPRRVVLAQDVGDIPIRYEAIDDHGLREVHLVLRSGTREERRVLAKLDGETRTDRGGHMLRATDPFLKKSHAPIEVLVEAKDNDPITGPKWGSSPAITVIPPDVGEPEARRLDGLRKLRDAVVDALAWRIGHEPPTADGTSDGTSAALPQRGLHQGALPQRGPHEAASPRRSAKALAAERKVFVADELRGAEENRELLEATLSSQYAGLRVPGRLQAMLRGHMRRVREAMNVEAKGPTAKTHGALVRATERLALVIDGIVRGLGQRDSKDASRQLADVADDLALGASQMQRASDRERGTARADGAVTVLQGGGRSLAHLGSLGRDLGEIVGADLFRVDRARKGDDLVHAEIAARDLAARLREPDPSFGSRGRSGGRRGGEGGGQGSPGAAGDEGEGEDDAEQAFNMAAQELERLAQDHAEELGKVERALSEALSDAEMKDLEEESKKHAAQVREAAKGLPQVGAGGDSWTNKAAQAHEHAEAMARALDQANPADAVKSGKSALDAIDEAKRTAQRENWMGLLNPNSDGNTDRKLNDARQKLEPEVKWAEEKLQSLRKQAAERKAGELSSDGDDEQKLAERARELGDKGQGQQALPDPALEALGSAAAAARDAANSLRRGDADKALEQQREAQRQLEMAKDALGNESEKGEPDHGEGDGSQLNAGHAAIPKADEHKGPEEFRRRVMRGLGQAMSGRQKDAVRRYADGLLR
jgi:hypothetical protein